MSIARPTSCLVELKSRTRSPPSLSFFSFARPTHDALPSTMRLLTETRASAVVRRPLDGWRASTTGTSPYTPTAACARRRDPTDRRRRGRPCALHADRLARRPERRRHIPRQLDSDAYLISILSDGGHEQGTMCFRWVAARGGRRAAPPSGGGRPHRKSLQMLGGKAKGLWRQSGIICYKTALLQRKSERHVIITRQTWPRSLLLDAAKEQDGLRRVVR